MGEKQVELRTSLSVKECGGAFKSGVEEGRGMSAKLGGITAKLMGGESLSWYTPQDNSVFASLNDDPPVFTVGAGVPKAQGAHTNGTNLEMYVWDRGDHREVVLWAHHSLTGASHATKLMDAVMFRIDPDSDSIGAEPAQPQPGPAAAPTPAPQVFAAPAPPPPPPPPPANIPAGWYPDPHLAYELRYWDGSRWTDHVSTRGEQAIDRR